MKRRQREAQRAQQWDLLTALLIARYEATGTGLPPRSVRDLIDEGRESGSVLEEWTQTRGLTGESSAFFTGTVRLGALLSAEWPVDAYPRLATCAVLAMDRGAYTVRGATEPQQATTRLVRIAETATGYGAVWGDLAGWMEVLAQITDPWIGDVVWSGVVNWQDRRPNQGIEIDRDESLAEWAAAFGALAPLVWAADMPFAEAVERQRQGALDGDGLATLAGLRGYQVTLPAGAG